MTIVRPQFSQEYHTETITTANDRALVFRPRLATSHSPGIIWCHGAGKPTPDLDVLGWQVAENCGRLASIGCTVLAADFGDYSITSGPNAGPNNWGTPAATSRIEAWRQWLVSQGVAASKVAVLGFSMGGYVSLAYKRDYPDKVACVASWNGFVDIKTCRDNRNSIQYPDWAGVASSIESAWQILPSDPLPSGADLCTNLAIKGTPWIRYYGSNDPIVPVSFITNMAAWIGSSAQTVNVGGIGHYGPVTMPAHFDQLSSFILDNMRGIT